MCGPPPRPRFVVTVPNGKETSMLDRSGFGSPQSHEATRHASWFIALLMFALLTHAHARQPIGHQLTLICAPADNAKSVYEFTDVTISDTLTITVAPSCDNLLVRNLPSGQYRGPGLPYAWAATFGADSTPTVLTRDMRLSGTFRITFAAATEVDGGGTKWQFRNEKTVTANAIDAASTTQAATPDANEQNPNYNINIFIAGGVVGPPGAPTLTTATPGDETATVTWTAPDGNGAAILRYDVTATDPQGNTFTCSTEADGGTPPATTCNLTGLTNGTTYTITVTASNTAGASPPSNERDVTPGRIPDAPVDLTATPLHRSAQITFEDGADGGSPITERQYCLVTAVSSCGPNGAWITLSPTLNGDTFAATIGNLTNGVANTIAVRLVNDFGAGPAATIAPVLASRLAVVIGANPTADGFVVTVTLVDDAGNPVLNAGAVGTVVLTLQSGTGTLLGAPTLTATIPVGSSSVALNVAYTVAEIDVSVRASGSGTLSALFAKSGVSNLVAIAAGVPAALSVGGYDVAQLRNVPFAVTVTLRDQFANPAPVATAGTVTLRGAGGAEAGALLDGASNDPQATIAAGASSVTFPAVRYTGLSAVGLRDVLLTGSFGALSGSGELLSVTDQLLRLEVEKAILLSGGGDTALVTARLERNDGAAVGGQSITFTTDHGVFEVAGVATASPATLTTDATGIAIITLRSDGYVGGVILQATCSNCPTAERTLAFLRVPQAPSNVTITPGDTTLSVAFDLDESAGAIDTLEVSLDGGLTWTPVATTSPLLLEGLTNGQPYTVTLRAGNAAGSSPASLSATGTPFGPPAAPTITGASSGNGVANVAFTLNDDNGAPIGNVEYSLDGGRTWITRAPASTTSPLLIDGLENGRTYDVAIRAVNAAGPSEPSNDVSVSPRAPEFAAPTNLTSVAGDARAWLYFGRVPDHPEAAVTNYQVQLDGGAWITLDPPQTTLPLRLTNLENGRTYSARVRAIGGGVISPISNLTTFTPQGPVPPEADITPEVPEESISVTPTERGTALLTFAFNLGNDGANTLYQVWLHPRNLPLGGAIVAIEPEEGAIERFDDSWHWTGIAVPPGGSTTAYVTVEVRAD
jgi:large repetitive protein